MDIELPETVTVATRVGNRLVLVRSMSEGRDYVTVDFEYRRWQLGEHAHRMLNHIGTNYKGRNWRRDLVQDAVTALLSKTIAEEASEGSKEAATSVQAQATPEPGPAAVAVLDLPITPPVESGQAVPEETTAFAWKRIQDGQISQDTTADSPEGLFVQAGFRPHRVLDPIQGFQCTPVRRKNAQWVEVRDRNP